MGASVDLVVALEAVAAGLVEYLEDMTRDGHAKSDELMRGDGDGEAGQVTAMTGMVTVTTAAAVVATTTMRVREVDVAVALAGLVEVAVNGTTNAARSSGHCR